MNYPTVIGYSYNGDKFRAEYTFDEFYDVYIWSENESVGPFLKDQEIELGWWIMYYHHSYDGIMEMINEQEKTMQQNTIQQMEQTVEQLLAKAEELKQQIESAKKEEDVWPKIGSRYWFALSNADVDNSTWNCGEVDEYRMMFGNVHRTKEDAENYVQKRLIQVELETLAKKAWKEVNEQVNWTDEYQSKYHIYYDYINKEFYVSANSNSQYIGQVFFPTKESASEAVKTIGEERLKKLFM